MCSNRYILEYLPSEWVHLYVQTFSAILDLYHYTNLIVDCHIQNLQKKVGMLDILKYVGISYFLFRDLAVFLYKWKYML